LASPGADDLTTCGLGFIPMSAEHRELYNANDANQPKHYDE